MRLFHASQAKRSASLRAAAAFSADARMEGPKMVARDLVSMLPRSVATDLLACCSALVPTIKAIKVVAATEAGA